MEITAIGFILAIAGVAAIFLSALKGLLDQVRELLDSARRARDAWRRFRDPGTLPVTGGEDEPPSAA
ncbi:hypothetical protein AB0M39_12565 [Streptomyces sp. NPDC051907]|uniref:hypothetical protein n=1 Tax=Streptomyces sp. NPDC051907 TaxID=3155284 RepID=UPI0034224116